MVHAPFGQITSHRGARSNRRLRSPPVGTSSGFPLSHLIPPTCLIPACIPNRNPRPPPQALPVTCRSCFLLLSAGVRSANKPGPSPPPLPTLLVEGGLGVCGGSFSPVDFATCRVRSAVSLPSLHTSLRPGLIAAPFVAHENELLIALVGAVSGSSPFHRKH